MRDRPHLVTPPRSAWRENRDQRDAEDWYTPHGTPERRFYPPRRVETRLVLRPVTLLIVAAISVAAWVELGLWMGWL
jgi:hypothetical protein